MHTNLSTESTRKFFPPIHKAKALLKNSSCGPDTEIDGPGSSSKYTGCPNIFDALSLMKLSTMDPLVFPRDLSTVVANDVSKLSMINASGGVSFPTFYFLCPERKTFCAGFIPGPATIVLSWGVNLTFRVNPTK